MLSEDEYIRLDGVAQADLVRRGELSAVDLLEVAIRRAGRLNPQLNAIVIPMHELAWARARGPITGPLAGVPFLLKDLFQDYAGILATSGCSALKRAGAKPDRHSEIVERELAAGLVIFGRTNTPEFGAKAITEPHAWGPTRNPWNLDYSPCGSSGGSAAAVAAGIVALAAASDGGGSIRVPSSATGLFGLKPGRGRTPSGPGAGEAIHGAAMNHVITRSVRDSAAVLDAIHGPEVGSLCRLAPPARSYSAEVERDPQALRVAFTTRSPLGTPVDPAAVAAVEETARLLESLGHKVEQAQPEIDGMGLGRDFLRIWFAQLAHQIRITRERCPDYKNNFEFDSLVMEAIAYEQPAPDYVTCHSRWGYYGFQLSQFLTRYDVYMTPTVAAPPPLVGDEPTPAWAAKLLRPAMPYGLARVMKMSRDKVEQMCFESLNPIPFTQLANVTGVPAMSVPLHTFANGLPLGIHFLAEHGGEGLLLSLAAQLERAAPWHDRRPSL